MTSVKRISRLSARPPNQPAIAPIGTPMAMTTIWTTIATVMLIRAPSSRRLNRSRPIWSVPRMWPGLNGGSGRPPFFDHRLEVLLRSTDTERCTAR